MKIIGSPSNIQTANKTVFIVKTKLMIFFVKSPFIVHCLKELIFLETDDASMTLMMIKMSKNDF